MRHTFCPSTYKRIYDGVDDRFITGAPAEVSGEGFAHFGAGWTGILAEQ
jgi:hypothetical protein